MGGGTGGTANIEVARKATRSEVLRVTRAYRTVSMDVAEVLAAMTPVDLVARAIALKYNRIKEGADPQRAAKMAEEDALQRWQQRWDPSTSWTRRLIPNIARWKDRKHGELTFHLTQLLTGHGCFDKYLHRIDKNRMPLCRCCKEEEDSVEHTLLVCPRWEQQRAELEGKIPQLTADRLVGEMLKDHDNWLEVASFAKKVLTTKDSDSRRDNLDAE